MKEDSKLKNAMCTPGIVRVGTCPGQVLEQEPTSSSSGQAPQDPAPPAQKAGPGPERGPGPGPGGPSRCSQ